MARHTIHRAFTNAVRARSIACRAGQKLSPQPPVAKQVIRRGQSFSQRWPKRASVAVRLSGRTLPLPSPPRDAGRRRWAVPGSNGRPPACKARAGSAAYRRLSRNPCGWRYPAVRRCALLRFVASTALPHACSCFARSRYSPSPSVSRAWARRGRTRPSCALPSASDSRPQGAGSASPAAVVSGAKAWARA